MPLAPEASVRGCFKEPVVIKFATNIKGDPPEFAETVKGGGH